MILTEIKYFKLTEHLPRLIQNSSGTYSTVNRLFIYGSTSAGSFWGEASPLEGFSKETIHDVEYALTNNIDKIINKEISERNIESLLKIFDDCPSLKFGIEQILLSALLSAGRQSDFFPKSFNKKIKLSPLIPILKKDEFINRFISLSSQGFKRIKIKIGKRHFSHELELLKNIQQLCNQNGILLRLDVNGAWATKEAVRNIEALSNFPIEYIEQPVKAVEDLTEVANSVKIPIAADEALTSPRNISTLLQSKVEYFIVKPTVLGGLVELLKLKNKLKKKRKRMILSSSFEGLIGSAYLLLISVILNGKEYEGITFLAEGRNKFPFVIKEGNIFFNLKEYFELQTNFAPGND